jgi:hypothetical protein
MPSLLLRIKDTVFDDIACGDQVELYRRENLDAWARKVQKGKYSHVLLQSCKDGSKKLLLPWNGYVVRRVTIRQAERLLETEDLWVHGRYLDLVVIHVDALAHELESLSVDQIDAMWAKTPEVSPSVAALSPAAVGWLANGERCHVSNLLFECLSGVDLMREIVSATLPTRLIHFGDATVYCKLVLSSARVCTK